MFQQKNLIKKTEEISLKAMINQEYSKLNTKEKQTI